MRKKGADDDIEYEVDEDEDEYGEEELKDDILNNDSDFNSMLLFWKQTREVNKKLLVYSRSEVE